MGIGSAIRRWRFRQRREVGRALWMHGPFTRREARTVGHQIGFSAVKAARMIRRHAQRLAHG